MISGSNTEDLISGRQGLKSAAFETVIFTDNIADNRSVFQAALASAKESSGKIANVLLIFEAVDHTPEQLSIFARWTDAIAAPSIDGSTGNPIGHLGMIELIGDSIENFKIMSIYPELFFVAQINFYV